MRGVRIEPSDARMRKIRWTRPSCEAENDNDIRRLLQMLGGRAYRKILQSGVEMRDMPTRPSYKSARATSRRDDQREDDGVTGGAALRRRI